MKKAKLLDTFFISLFLLMVYLPYILKGGFIYDDWSVWNLGVNCPGLINSFKCYWPSFSNRPLAPIFYALTTNLFGGQASGYIIVNLFLWLGVVLILTSLSKKHFGRFFALLFLFFSVSPTISTTVIFSPAMQSIGSLAIFVWTLSLLLLDKFLTKDKRADYFFSYILMLASLLIYEISFPLLIISVLWPFLTRKEKYFKFDKKILLYYFLTFILPVLTVIGFVLFYQKYLIVLFYPDISRFRIKNLEEFINLSKTIRFLLFNVFKSETPQLMIKAIKRLKDFNLQALLTLGIGLFTFLKAINTTSNKKKIFDKKMHFLMILLFFGAFYGVVILFVSAMIGPTAKGYLNRGLSSTSLFLALFLSYIGTFLQSKNKSFFKIFFLFLFIGYLAAFLLQRDNYIAATDLNKTIIDDVIFKMNSVIMVGKKDGGQKNKLLILGNVPEFLDYNFNDETVFSDEVGDWGLALKLKSYSLITGGVTITKKKLAKGRIKIDDQNLIVDNYLFASIQDLWFYQYNQKTKESGLIKIAGRQDLQQILEEIKTNPDSN